MQVQPSLCGLTVVVVVETEKTAMECLGYMKEQRLGTATFIPLDKIKVKPVSEKLRMLGRNVKPVIGISSSYLYLLLQMS